jgi:hypothetical protein
MPWSRNPKHPDLTVQQTRASYRAAQRHRAKLAQLDLVDLIVRAP